MNLALWWITLHSLRAYKLTTVQLLVFWSESRGINCHVYSLMKLEASGTIKENKRVWYPNSVNFMEMWSLKLFLSLQRLNFCFTFKSGGDATWIFSNERNWNFWGPRYKILHFGGAEIDMTEVQRLKLLRRFTHGNNWGTE